MKSLRIWIVFFICLAVGLFCLDRGEKTRPSDDFCSDIVVGKDASVDGSVITSHTGCGPNCRIHVVPAQTFPAGAEAPVYYGIQEVKRPLLDYGEVIGHIPQVKKTYAYIHSAYPHINEHQLAIGESTLSQRDELKVDRAWGARQIMTIEQAQIFALQRCTKAREAVKLIGELMETYGFLTSCGPEDAKIPLAFNSDREALAGVLMTLRPYTLEDLRIVHIKSTLELIRLLVSKGCVSQLENNAGVHIETETSELEFDESGNLISAFG